MLISDAHAHVSSLGLGGKVIGRKFKEVGGWFIALISLPPSSYGFELTYEGFIKSLNTHVNECKHAAEEGLKVFCAAGIHPASVDKLLKAYNVNKVLQILHDVLKYIVNLIERGLINGLGEFGRPHYKAMPEAFIVNELLLEDVLKVVHDRNIPIHLHLEQRGVITVESIDRLVRKLNVKRDLVIFHHVSGETAIEAIKRGYPVTVPAFSDAVKHLLSNNLYFMVESDYLDDPKRPGVVRYPWDIALLAQDLLKDGYSTDVLSKIFIENIVNVYGVTPV